MSAALLLMWTLFSPLFGLLGAGQRAALGAGNTRGRVPQPTQTDSLSSTGIQRRPVSGRCRALSLFSPFAQSAEMAGQMLVWEPKPWIPLRQEILFSWPLHHPQVCSTQASGFQLGAFSQSPPVPRKSQSPESSRITTAHMGTVSGDNQRD